MGGVMSLVRELLADGLLPKELARISAETDKIEFMYVRGISPSVEGWPSTATAADRLVPGSGLRSGFALFVCLDGSEIEDFVGPNNRA